MENLRIFIACLSLAALPSFANQMSVLDFMNVDGHEIVGGTQSDQKKHPYIVSLEQNGQHFCGGTLVAAKFVLTAGHCTDFLPVTDIRVIVGTQDVQPTDPGAETHKVVKVTRHPGFINSGSTLTHDFAVLQLDSASAFTPAAMIEANSDRFKIPSDGNSTTMGWGTTAEGGSISKTLREVTIPLVTDDKCKAAYPGQIDETMFCAGLDAGGKDACQGDSGGPIIAANDKDDEILIGTVSWGDGCAEPGKYGVYGNLSFARKWVDGIINAKPAHRNALAAADF